MSSLGLRSWVPRGSPAAPPPRPSRGAAFVRRTLGMLVHEHSSPLQLGAGVALGAFLGTTPLYGLHLVLALGLAALLRVNLAGAALGTQISNPLFAPFLALASVRVGTWMGIGGAAASVGGAAAGTRLFEAWLAGGLVLGVACGLVLGTAAGAVRALVLFRRSRAPKRERE